MKPRIASVSFFALAASLATAQSFNVDLDVLGGPPEAGHGAPSSSFGAAANQPGFWNAVSCTSPGPEPLFNLGGQSTGVTMSVTGFGSGGGSGFAINTGDYALLLNDYASIPDSMTYTFTGLAPGAYRVYTYAVNATGLTVPVQVTVDGATGGAQTVTGPMPGNSFQYLVTHSIHDVPNVTGNLVLRLAGPWSNASVNGFQIVAVPEPATVAVLGGASLLALLRPRRTRRAR